MKDIIFFTSDVNQKQFGAQIFFDQKNLLNQSLDPFFSNLNVSLTTKQPHYNYFNDEPVNFYVVPFIHIFNFQQQAVVLVTNWQFVKVFRTTGLILCVSD